MTKVAAWMGARLDRFAGRWSQLTEAFAVRWYRGIDRIAGRWERFGERLSVGWERARERIVRGRRPPTERAGGRWSRVVDGIGERRERFAETLSVGWYRLPGLLHNRWERSVRPRVGRRGRRLADSVMAFTLVGIICLASAVALSTLLDTVGDRPATGTEGFDVAGMRPAQGDRPGESTEEGSSGSELAEPPDGFRVHRDQSAGYSFSYPADWELSASGETDRLVGPGGDVTISFSVTPGGSIQRLSERLVDSLANRYGDFELVAGDDGETAQGERSLVVGGQAVDTDGSTIRFVVITIRGPDGNRAITVRFSAEADPLDVSPRIRQIVESFKASGAATAP